MEEENSDRTIVNSENLEVIDACVREETIIGSKSVQSAILKNEQDAFTLDHNKKTSCGLGEEITVKMETELKERTERTSVAFVSQIKDEEVVCNDLQWKSLNYFREECTIKKESFEDEDKTEVSSNDFVVKEEVGNDKTLNFELVLVKEEPEIKTESEKSDQFRDNIVLVKEEHESILDPEPAGPSYSSDGSEKKCRLEMSSSTLSECSDFSSEMHTKEESFNCSYCQYITTNKYYFRRHMKNHTHRKPYSCSYCEYGASNKGALECHIRIHTKEKPYICSFCDYRATTLGNLRRHVKNHSEDKPYLCSFCDYRAITLGNLRRHLSTHTEEKLFACALCDYRTSDKGNFKRHTSTHTGEKPYFCSLCNYRALQKRSLFEHMRSHTGEKPFLCSLCDYKASDKSNIRRHMRIHTGEKRFLCSLCDYRTSRNYHLNRHMVIHGTKP